LISHIQSTDFNRKELFTKDCRGNTPLVLSSKLSAQDEDFLKVVKFLIENGSDPGKERDLEGWSVMDEAISATNTRLLGLFFDEAMSKR
jgi:ankyrin repeat protein